MIGSFCFFLHSVLRFFCLSIHLPISIEIYLFISSFIHPFNAVIYSLMHCNSFFFFFLLLHNKFPHTWQLETKHIYYYLIVSMGSESGQSLSGSLVQSVIRLQSWCQLRLGLIKGSRTRSKQP